MKFWVITTAACLLMQAGLESSATEPPTPANADEVEVDRAIVEYTDAFIKGDLEGVVAHCATPFVAVSSKGFVVLATPAEIEARYVAALRALRLSGYAYNKTKEIHIKLLDENLALVSGTFVRYRENGSEIETVGATYLLLKQDGKWKIEESISQPPDRAVR